MNNSRISVNEHLECVDGLGTSELQIFVFSILRDKSPVLPMRLITLRKTFVQGIFDPV